MMSVQALTADTSEDGMSKAENRVTSDALSCFLSEVDEKQMFLERRIEIDLFPAPHSIFKPIDQWHSLKGSGHIVSTALLGGKEQFKCIQLGGPGDVGCTSVARFESPFRGMVQLETEPDPRSCLPCFSTAFSGVRPTCASQAAPLEPDQPAVQCPAWIHRRYGLPDRVHTRRYATRLLLPPEDAGQLVGSERHRAPRSTRYSPKGAIYPD